MNRVARWRWWLASVIVGRRPRTARAVFVPVGTPWWRRQWLRLTPPNASPPPHGRMLPIQKWMTAPDDELGVAVPMQHVVASSEQAVVVLASCVAYTTGFQLGVGVRRKQDPPPLPIPPARYEPVELSLEVGIRFSDGRESVASGWGMQQQVRSYMEAFAAGEDPAVPLGPIIGRGGGGGGGRRHDMNYWVWPLPPGGPLTISCHWPAGGVPDGQVEVDGSAIRRAGLSSQKLWTD